MRSSIEFAALASYYKEETWETETDYRPENGNVAASCADRKQISCGLAKHKPDTCEEGGDVRCPNSLRVVRNLVQNVLPLIIDALQGHVGAQESLARRKRRTHRMSKLRVLGLEITAAILGSLSAPSRIFAQAHQPTSRVRVPISQI
jgi:hypothetical protein